MKTKLPSSISTVFEVALFIKNLGENQELFHPDDSSDEIIDYDTRERVFTDAEAELLDGLWGDAMDVCDENDLDIYELCCKYLQQSGDPLYANYFDASEPTFDQMFDFTKN